MPTSPVGREEEAMEARQWTTIDRTDWAPGLWDGEPDKIHPGYRQLDNVFLLPHIGSATTHTRNAMGYRAIDNLVAIFSAREPGDRVA